MVLWVAAAARCIPGGPMTRSETVLVVAPIVLLFSSTMGFSCFRDAVALRAAPAPAISAPLHP